MSLKAKYVCRQYESNIDGIEETRHKIIIIIYFLFIVFVICKRNLVFFQMVMLL